MKTLKAFLFDLDDTLYCEHEYVRSGFRAIADFLHDQYNYLTVEMVYEAIVQEWTHNGRGKVFDNVCSQFNIRPDIKRLVQIYREHVPVLELYNDAKVLLNALQKRKNPTAIITDGESSVQWRKIEALNLKQLISCIIVTDDYGKENWKPSPFPYEKAAECLGVAKTDCVYIGDNPNKDFVMAKQLGMHTIRLIRPLGDHMRTELSEEYEANEIIETLDELLVRL